MTTSIESINVVLSGIVQEFDKINSVAVQPVGLEIDLPTDTMQACEKVLEQLTWAACLANEADDQLTESALDCLVARTYNLIDQI